MKLRNGKEYFTQNNHDDDDDDDKVTNNEDDRSTPTETRKTTMTMKTVCCRVFKLLPSVFTMIGGVHALWSIAKVFLVREEIKVQITREWNLW